VFVVLESDSCFVLCCVVLCCVVLCVLCCVVPCCVLRCAVLCCAVLCCAVLSSGLICHPSDALPFDAEAVRATPGLGIGIDDKSYNVEGVVAVPTPTAAASNSESTLTHVCNLLL
jgi:hypothetical protein